MTSANAKRQARYRARHLAADDRTVELLNTIIDRDAKRALERLARCYEAPQRHVLAHLLLTADQAVRAVSGTEGLAEPTESNPVGRTHLVLQNLTVAVMPRTEPEQNMPMLAQQPPPLPRTS